VIQPSVPPEHRTLVARSNVRSSRTSPARDKIAATTLYARSPRRFFLHPVALELRNVLIVRMSMDCAGARFIRRPASRTNQAASLAWRSPARAALSLHQLHCANPSNYVARCRSQDHRQWPRKPLAAHISDERSRRHRPTHGVADSPRGFFPTWLSTPSSCGRRVRKDDSNSRTL